MPDSAMIDKFKIPSHPAEIVWVEGNAPSANDERLPEFAVVLTWGDDGQFPIMILRIEDRWVFDNDDMRHMDFSQEDIQEAKWWALVGVYDVPEDAEYSSRSKIN